MYTCMQYNRLIILIIIETHFMHPEDEGKIIIFHTKIRYYDKGKYTHTYICANTDLSNPDSSGKQQIICRWNMVEY